MKRCAGSSRASLKTLFFTLALALFSMPNESPASNPTQGAKAAAMGTAVVAIADDPSAIAHNPAGLTNLKGTQIYGGSTALTIRSTFENPEGATEKTLFQIFVPPHMYACSDFGLENMAFGLGIFSPLGIGGRRWSEVGLTRYVSTESFTGTFDVNPSFAWSPFPGFSLGLGVDYIHAFSKSKRKIQQPFPGASDGDFKFKGDGGGWGFNLGVLYSFSEKTSFGATYRSRVKARQKGSVTLENIAPALQPLFGGSGFETHAETTAHFPAVVSAGVAFHPAKKWTFGFDVEWADWSRFSMISFDLEREVPEAGFTDVAMNLDWGSSWLLKFGMEHALTERISLRGGYVYVKSPVPDSTLSPDHPDSDQHNFAFGIGYKFGRHVIDAFYNFTFFTEREVTNPILSGKYEGIIHAVGFSLGYRF
jgi:long-chain fatty acid transport protein